VRQRDVTIVIPIYFFHTTRPSYDSPINEEFPQLFSFSTVKVVCAFIGVDVCGVDLASKLTISV
jgi:hypothetical protein